MGVRWGIPIPNMAGYRPYSTIITFPITELSILFKLYSFYLIYYSILSTELPLERLRERREDDYDLSRELHPLHEHIWQPSIGNLVFLLSFATRQRHDFPDLENSFMHLWQHPFLQSKSSYSISILLSYIDILCI